MQEDKKCYFFAAVCCGCVEALENFSSYMQNMID